jgi:hypothetical protein
LQIEYHRCKKYSNSKSKVEPQDPFKLPSISNVYLPYLSLIDLLRLKIANPLIFQEDGSGLWLFGFDNNEICEEFRSTPFNKQSRKYSELLTFEYQDHEFCIGQTIFCQSDNLLYRLDQLSYKEVDVS